MECGNSSVLFGKARDYVLGVTVMIKLLGIFPREVLKDSSTNMAPLSIPTFRWETGSPRETLAHPGLL